MVKRYLALARVSSREQEREGFSLEVQEEGFQKYATKTGGEIAKLFRIAETATKPQERRVFREFLSYARQHAKDLSGVLFFKVDRAARNLFDYVELERLEAEHGLDVIYITQPTENTPAGRMMRRTLANMASFFTEQQSLDVKDGLARRVQAGLFVGKAPYGYRNIRRNGRSVVELHPIEAQNVRRAFDLYAYHGHTLDSLRAKLREEGLIYCPSMPDFSRSKLHTILRDRSYIGELLFRGTWHPGTHDPLIERPTWDRTQVLLGTKVYQSHELTYASSLITCGQCQAPITGERKLKTTKRGPREYIYYRCSRYNSAGHSKVRLEEANLDQQVLGLFRRIRIGEQAQRDWFRSVLRASGQEARRTDDARITELNRQLSLLRQQQDRLLNLRLLEEIDSSTFGAKSQELRDRIAHLSLDVEGQNGSRAEMACLAEKVFELSQTLEQKWVASGAAEKRSLLKTVCLNFSLDDVTLVPTIRKPFDVLAGGLSVSFSRGDRI